MTLIAADLATETPPAGPARIAVVGQAVRYFAASLAALVVDASLLWLCVERLAVPVWVAGAIGYAVGLVVVYGLSIRWVFPDRVVRDRRSEFVLFAALGVVGLVVNSSVLLGATAFGLSLPWAKVIAAAIGFTTNFASRKLLLFTRRP